MKTMKKIALYSLLALAGIALSACTEDYKDWAEPTSPTDPGTVSVSFTPSGVNTASSSARRRARRR